MGAGGDKSEKPKPPGGKTASVKQTMSPKKYQKFQAFVDRTRKKKAEKAAGGASPGARGDSPTRSASPTRGNEAAVPRPDQSSTGARRRRRPTPGPSPSSPTGRDGAVRRAALRPRAGVIPVDRDAPVAREASPARGSDDGSTSKGGKSKSDGKGKGRGKDRAKGKKGKKGN